VSIVRAANLAPTAPVDRARTVLLAYVPALGLLGHAPGGLTLGLP
jgi:hypothetical protein